MNRLSELALNLESAHEALHIELQDKESAIQKVLKDHAAPFIVSISEKWGRITLCITQKPNGDSKTLSDYFYWNSFFEEWTYFEAAYFDIDEKRMRNRKEPTIPDVRSILDKIKEA